jgi:hypothetical protein
VVFGIAGTAGRTFLKIIYLDQWLMERFALMLSREGPRWEAARGGGESDILIRKDWIEFTERGGTAALLRP